MKRRQFTTLLGSAAAAAAVLSSLAARAQTPAIIGMMTMAAPTSIRQPLASFRTGLMQSGFVEGQNVKIEYRSAEGQFDRIPALIADLVRRQPSLLMLASPTAVLAAKRATATIPIVFVSGDDPVKRGLGRVLINNSGPDVRFRGDKRTSQSHVESVENDPELT